VKERKKIEALTHTVKDVEDGVTENTFL
jgi:hypothetical protein